MSYTHAGAPGLTRRIEGDLAHITDAVRRAFRPSAIVLGGSYGRGEGAGTFESGEWRALNDYDIWVVVDGSPATGEAQSLGRLLAAQLEVDFVDIAVVTQSQLRGMPCSQLAYDLRHGGRVLWGTPDILSCIPSFDSTRIPARDALTLLFNRAAGLIGHFAAPDFSTRAADPPDATRAVQLGHAWTACGDAVLLLTGRYDHRCGVKAQRAPAAIAAARVLDPRDAERVGAAYRSRVGEPVDFGPRGVAYHTAAAALGSTLSWALQRFTFPADGSASLDALLNHYERLAATRNLRAWLAAFADALRARSTAPLRQRPVHARIQSDCVRTMLLPGPGTNLPADWDATRTVVYDAWHRISH